MWRSKTGGLWRKTEEEGERGRRERERGRWRDREAKKGRGRRGGFFSRLESGRHIN